MTAAAPRPASPWRRLAARLVDLVAVFFCLFALAVLGAGALIDGAGQARLAFVLLYAAYEAVYVGALGQTPGKDLLRVQVARSGRDGGPGPAAAVARLPLPVLPMLAPDPLVAIALVAATGLTSLLRPDRRALHDLLARTWVVDRPPDPRDADAEPDDEALQRLRREHGPFRRLFDRG